MTVHRGALHWGVFLVFAGTVALLVQWSIVDPAVPGRLLQLWPVALVAVGIGLILRLTPLAALGGILTSATLGLLAGAALAGGIGAVGGACIGTGAGGEALTRTGTAGGDRFRLELELTCGDVAVSRVPGAGWSVESRHAPGRPPGVDEAASSVSLRSEASRSLLPFEADVRRQWLIDLPADPVVGISMTLNAADARVDLGGGRVDGVQATLNAAHLRLDLGRSAMAGTGSLGMTFNAASGTLVLPAGSLDGRITLNASSLALCVDPDAGLRIDHEGTLSSAELGGQGMVRTGEGWQTPGFETADAPIDLHISSTVSSISLDRTAGCP